MKRTPALVSILVAAPASKHDLLRRAYLDLTGLPPTPEDQAAFEKDSSPEAFAKVVDKLLASPRYGERWGRIWLDVARYGEDDYRSLNPNPRGYRPPPPTNRDCPGQAPWGTVALERERGTR